MFKNSAGVKKIGRAEFDFYIKFWLNNAGFYMNNTIFLIVLNFKKIGQHQIH
jgi:hypothetical protein